MTPASERVDWPGYLERFHAANPGITEDVLARCTSPVGTPYDWLVEDLDASARILDLACGSGPARPNGAPRWIGLDLSAAELRRARAAGRSTVVLGDASDLPFPGASFDAVTCSMALMLVQPLDRAVREVGRVLRPGGRLVLLLPASQPLSVGDRIRYARLFWAARSTAGFPSSPLRRSAHQVLAPHGLEVESDEHRRFVHPLLDASEAARFVDSWYLPGTSAARRARAGRRAGSMAPASIGVPLRRLLARKVGGHAQGRQP